VVDVDEVAFTLDALVVIVDEVVLTLDAPAIEDVATLDLLLATTIALDVTAEDFATLFAAALLTLPTTDEAVGEIDEALLEIVLLALETVATTELFGTAISDLVTITTEEAPVPVPAPAPPPPPHALSNTVPLNISATLTCLYMPADKYAVIRVLIRLSSRLFIVNYLECR